MLVGQNNLSLAKDKEDEEHNSFMPGLAVISKSTRLTIMRRGKTPGAVGVSCAMEIGVGSRQLSSLVRSGGSIVSSYCTLPTRGKES